MAIKGSLDIRGFKRVSVPNAYYRQKAETDALCLIFGGWHYSTEMPVFYYTRRVLSGLGFDVLTIDSSHSSDRRYARLSDRKRQEWFLSEVDAAFEAARHRRRYRRIVVAAKSIGTMALAHLLLSGKLTGHVYLIWLSPLLEAESIRENLQTCATPSLVVIGKRDPQYDEALVKGLSKNGKLDLMLIERANEDIEVEGDALRSIELLAGYVGRLKSFLGASSDSPTRKRREAPSK
ncbi:MAG TPA: hypothetical protein VMW69_12555 [Spirochaetia bacterium]|nr:hypothetical protein [Spirochaetia bacterium]